MKILIGTIGILMLLAAVAPTAFAQIGAPLSKHPISDMLSGYDHWVADAKDPCKPDCRNVYIWHSPNGFINQTKEFIDGYVLGFCSISDANTSMDEPEADFDCNEGPSSAGWMVGETITSTYTSKFGP